MHYAVLLARAEQEPGFSAGRKREQRSAAFQSVQPSVKARNLLERKTRFASSPKLYRSSPGDSSHGASPA